MNRRNFLGYGCGCALAALAQRSVAQEPWTPPARFVRPERDTDEGGLWAMMDREEARLRRSPFVIRDRRLNEQVRAMACRLAGDHCPDLRVYLVDNPLFNANMAPNGMMQVWSGLMLRADNEAQLAAVLGHEIGHYLARHSIERLRDTRTRAGFAQFLGLFGLVGAVGQIATIAGGFAYSRDHELEADRIGLHLMSQAGYDPMEAVKVWGNLLTEYDARPPERRSSGNPMFATHPPAADRRDTLAGLAARAPGGVANAESWDAVTASLRHQWLLAEVKRGQHEESIALLDRKIAAAPAVADYVFARAEICRLRAQADDLVRAEADYLTAVQIGNEPAATHRGLGLVRRARQQPAEARASFTRYLELAPDAPDAAMFKHYLQELAQ